jgi:lactate dehydrogenase-like 2-hydroxyacid dehydrogenase
MAGAFYGTAQKLRLVQLFSPGYDHVNLDAAWRAGCQPELRDMTIRQ